ncbi:COP9 signalosome complex subunit 7 isoform X1 [Drosophila guanche]|uniref:COP9 signalosome complex subunit 7 isoform X1 n=1 Tax=Drosophila guanche TaxID=7266 RepID=UPI0014717A62|nr:COP9 signalosome complex subunit 7 isoform X1 [Drosophila guanche]
MTQDMLLDNEEPAKSKETFLEKFCVLAKNATGAALLDVLKQALEAPNVFVFGELLVEPNVAELKDGPDAKYYNTLNLFAYGTYKEYRSKAGDYIELSPAMQKKLQHLTIVSLAIKTKSIPYALLQQELEIDNVRHLEDIIIEAIYADIIHGKLFQNTRILEVEYAQGRDIPPGNTGKIVETLQAWVNSCDGVSSCIENQIKYANAEKSKRLFNKDRVEKDLINLKKILKSQASDSDESMQIDTHGPSGSGVLSLADLRKKPSKMKAQRNAGVVGLKFSK